MPLDALLPRKAAMKNATLLQNARPQNALGQNTLGQTKPGKAPKC